MHEPYTYLNGLTVGDLEDLLADISVYKDIDLERNGDFWADIVVIVEDELTKLRKMDARSQYEVAAERRQGINKAVADDVQKVFEGKTSGQLSALQKSIEAKLAQRKEGVDVSYWESLLSQLKAHLARARLRDRHKDNLRKKLQLLKAEQSTKDKEEFKEPVAGPSTEVKKEEPNSSSEDEGSSKTGRGECAIHRENPRELLKVRDFDADQRRLQVQEEKRHDPAVSRYNSGGYSPVYIPFDNLEPGTIVVGEAEDESRRAEDRKRSLRGGKVCITNHIEFP